MITAETLRPLSDAIAVSGAEGEIRNLIRAALPGVDLQTDLLGSLTAYIPGTGDARRAIMLTAPMDEIGFMVSGVGDNGLISMVEVGHHEGRYLPASRVTVGKAKQPGVFMWVPIHRSIKQTAVQDADAYQVDVGATSAAQVQAKVGERIAFANQFTAMSEQVVRGKALDTRGAVAVLLELLARGPFPFDLYAVFTAQSHIMARGAAAAATRIQPAFALSIAGVPASDIPPDLDLEEHAQRVALGGGPVLRYKNGQAIGDARMLMSLNETAAQKGITVQSYVLGGWTETEGLVTSIVGGATRSVEIGYAVRHLGSPNSLVDLRDLNRLVDLLLSALANLL